MTWYDAYPRRRQPYVVDVSDAALAELAAQGGRVMVVDGDGGHFAGEIDHDRDGRMIVRVGAPVTDSRIRVRARG
jgi:hypothetical protein